MNMNFTQAFFDELNKQAEPTDLPLHERMVRKERELFETDPETLMMDDQQQAAQAQQAQQPQGQPGKPGQSAKPGAAPKKDAKPAAKPEAKPAAKMTKTSSFMNYQKLRSYRDEFTRSLVNPNYKKQLDRVLAKRISPKSDFGGAFTRAQRQAFLSTRKPAVDAGDKYRKPILAGGAALLGGAYLAYRKHKKNKEKRNE